MLEIKQDKTSKQRCREQGAKLRRNKRKKKHRKRQNRARKERKQFLTIYFLVTPYVDVCIFNNYFPLL